MKEHVITSPENDLKRIRETAEKHWQYTKLIIEATIYAIDPDIEETQVNGLLKLMSIVYIEPFVHGYKHRLEEEGLI